MQNINITVVVIHIIASRIKIWGMTNKTANILD